MAKFNSRVRSVGQGSYAKSIIKVLKGAPLHVVCANVKLFALRHILFENFSNALLIFLKIGPIGSCRQVLNCRVGHNSKSICARVSNVGCFSMLKRRRMRLSKPYSSGLNQKKVLPHSRCRFGFNTGPYGKIQYACRVCVLEFSVKVKC